MAEPAGRLLARPRAQRPAPERSARRHEGLERRAANQAAAGYGALLGARPAGPQPVQRAGRTGLPDSLRTGIELLSGRSMDGVKVHRNSPKPAQLGANAYAQGRDIYLAPGQDRHLPHEAWHLVQQAEGRVRPTRQMHGGVPVNDDSALEREADAMGAAALKRTARDEVRPDAAPVQRRLDVAQLDNEGKAVGGVGLAAVGALVGTMINPGLGTVIGAVAGGLIGIFAGQVYDKRDNPFSWKLYINPKDFDQAVWHVNPGGMYDKDKSKGYQASMIKALQTELFGAKLGTRVDYDEYTRLHDLVTSNLKADGVWYSTSLESIRTPSSVEAKTSFPINDWSDDQTPPAKDLAEETVLGLPMVTGMEPKMHLPNEEAIERGKQPSVTVFDPSDGQFFMRYSEADGKKIVTAILDRYYNEIEAAKLDEDPEEAKEHKLDAIVKVIRALHVAHPFKDANGRLHVQLMLNKFLLEQGFDLTVMPKNKGLGVFGGAFSLAELKKMVKAGFKAAPPKPKDKQL
jgi:hypothetical protein